MSMRSQIPFKTRPTTFRELETVLATTFKQSLKEMVMLGKIPDEAHDGILETAMKSIDISLKAMLHRPGNLNVVCQDMDVSKFLTQGVAIAKDVDIQLHNDLQPGNFPVVKTGIKAVEIKTVKTQEGQRGLWPGEKNMFEEIFGVKEECVKKMKEREEKAKEVSVKEMKEEETAKGAWKKKMKEKKEKARAKADRQRRIAELFEAAAAELLPQQPQEVFETNVSEDMLLQGEDPFLGG